MKLLQINVSANWGSTGKIAEQIGECALAHGWESYIAYGRSSNKSKSHLIRIGSKAGQAWHLIISRLYDMHGLGSRLATKRLIRKIEEIKPDIIHLHNIHGYYINYKLLFEYLNSIDTPIVWTLHDCWSFTGHCAHFVEAECNKWQKECGNCKLLAKYPRAFMDNSRRNHIIKRGLFTKANVTIVPVSNWLSNYVHNSFLSSKHCVVIHNGVNIDTFRPIDANTDSKKNILGVSSVWDDSKGLSDFYKLRSMLPTSIYNITLVGLTKAQINNLPDGIIGIERTNNVEELVQLYNRANAFVNPTYADTFPTTNLEAIACGTPVITYKTGGSPESISVNTGIVVEQGDIDGLAQAIKTICNNGKDYYRDACREHALRHFDKTTCFEKYIELYDNILTKKYNHNTNCNETK